MGLEFEFEILKYVIRPITTIQIVIKQQLSRAPIRIRIHLRLLVEFVFVVITDTRTISSVELNLLPISKNKE